VNGWRVTQRVTTSVTEDCPYFRFAGHPTTIAV
jgi:hypothetical protein